VHGRAAHVPVGKRIGIDDKGIGRHSRHAGT
jgi:hypothetical protein